MEIPSLNYEAMMYLHGAITSRNAVMLTEIFGSEDVEMACLDMQLKTIIDHCLYVAIAREKIDVGNFQSIMESYVTMPVNPFTWFGRDEDGEGRETMANMVVGVLQPLRAFLCSYPDDSSEDYVAFLDKLISIYG